MNKKLLSLLLVLSIILSFTLIGCNKNTGTNEKATPGNESNQKTEEKKPSKKFALRFSTASVPTDAHTEALYKFKEAIEKSTDGQITVEVYHSGSLYGQGEDCEATIRGDLEMCYMSAQWIAEKVPEVSMFTAGYIFKDYNHMTKVLNGEIGRELFDTVAKKIGARPLAAFYLGARQLNLRDIGREVKTPADLKGVKLRMPNTPAWLFLGKALGANPTPLAFNEVYLALKTGTVDGQDNPLPTTKNAKFYEVTKYIILTEHVIDSVWPTINEKVWQEMGPDLQKKMLEAVEVARQYCDKKNLDAEKELVEFFKQQGLTVIEPDKEAFRNAVQKAYLDNKEISGKWDMELYNKIQELAK
ncbi:sialic acid TRAP transporter substrate-binding protein SiaP [Caldicoprobacter algeriensis]|uniref:sialic acid TRAP transporter substrate-binding protein SiaP n=1 Tax=Caldicoprobacter algeriensis TaxID=699281 RepID=UPI0020799375|nr:sialic acid TRAP transporter substrate-binding protein SiaP [Caldicoprobacter algeriensis]MCM8900195.1 sialic acid TRAP transporter substrate-binding protein SiaP [Caldicoprobacter algeriensis]